MFCAMRAPFALNHGPAPMRSRALTAAWPLPAAALRYACHVLLLPAAVPRVWQMRSAPAMPPRSAPLPDPALVTKNDIGCGGAAGGCCAVARYAPPRIAIATPTLKLHVCAFIIHSYLLNSAALNSTLNVPN